MLILLTAKLDNVERHKPLVAPDAFVVILGGGGVWC